jgi:hypothetical protein
MIFRGGEFSTGEMGNFHPPLNTGILFSLVTSSALELLSAIFRRPGGANLSICR